MNDEKLITPISETGATISLVTSKTNSFIQCEPSVECRPLCEPCTDSGSECAPDCTCSPCDEPEKEHIPDHDLYPDEEIQGCEPHT